MIYKFIQYKSGLNLAKDECTQIPAINNKKGLICIDCNNVPITGIVIGDSSISYFEDGVFHNIHGPALIIFNGNNNFKFEFHYKGKNTNCKTQEEFNDYIKKVVFE